MKNKEKYINLIKISKLVLLLVFLFSTYNSNAQFYEYGQEPASVNWLKIDSDHFKLIYPEELKRDAIKVLSLLEKNYQINSSQLDHQPKKIPVILHTHSVRSNGFVIWAPKRMELFMFPDVNSISQDWYSHLSLHEFRHVIQVDKMNKAFSKVLSIFIGEMGIGPAAALTPFWLLEGDAVYAETSLSESGRGRLPEFEMGIKANLLSEEKQWSYSKSYLGSHKDYVPNYYQYGYQMVSYGREKYGDDLWSGAFDHIGKRPFLINPLYFYLKKQTGSGKTELYKNTLGHLETHWTKELETNKAVDYKSLNRENKKFTSYNYPQIMDDSSVIAVKSGYHIIDRFVKISPEGEEETIHIPGYLNSGRISVKNQKIVWDEYVPDFRWKNRSFSVVQEYDISTGKLRVLGGYGSRFSSPSYSASGDSLVAVETTLSNDFSLVFISGLDGGIFYKIKTPENIHIMDPAWIDGSDKIVMTALNDQGKSLIIYDRSEGSWSELMAPSPFNINNLRATNKFLFFHADFGGKDNIFALSYSSKKLFRISNSKFGAFQPDVNYENGSLSFSEFSNKGYNIVYQKISGLDFEEFDSSKPVSEQAFFKYLDDKSIEEVSESSDDYKDLKSEKYSKLSNILHFHSWSPFYYDYSNPEIENPDVSPGISLLSQNLLSTAVGNLSYEYKDGDHFFHTGFTYKGWLPVIDFSYSYGGDPNIAPRESTDPPTDISRASSYRLLSYIPLSLNAGKWNLGIQPIFQITYYSDYYFYTDGTGYQKGITYTRPRLYLYGFQKTAYQDLIPRWGAILDLQNLSSPFEKEQKGSISSIKSTLYVPGLFRGHGFRIKAEKQGQNYERYAFSNQLTFPRGYEDVMSEKLTKYSFDYYLTLLYPDWNIEGFIYLKRISTQLFSDYIYGEGLRIPVLEEDRLAVVNGSYQSFGAELRFEYHLFRMLFPINSGVRFSYLQNTGEIKTEAIFSIDLNRF